MNRPRVWVCLRDQRWFGEIHRNPAMHGFFREHFWMSFDSFQALCHILSPFIYFVARSVNFICYFFAVFVNYRTLLIRFYAPYRGWLKFPLLQCSKCLSFFWSCWLSMSYPSFQNSLPANEVNSITLPARTMFQASKFLAKLTDLGTVTRIGKDTSNAAEQYNCC